MASRKKKAPTAEAVVGLRQKSLHFFFSKPSVHASPHGVLSLQQQATPLLTDMENDSRSSSLQDVGDCLRWSQLLTGWSPNLEVRCAPKEMSVNGGMPVDNKVKSENNVGDNTIDGKEASSHVNNGVADIVGEITQVVTSQASANVKNDDPDVLGVYAHDATSKSDERREAWFSVRRGCKRRRSQRTHAQHPCLPFQDDCKFSNTETELHEVPTKCCSESEARKSSCTERMHDDGCVQDHEPNLQSLSLDSKHLCEQKSIETNIRERESKGAASVIPMIETPVLQSISAICSAGGERDSPLKFDADEKNGICDIVSEVLEAAPINSIYVDASNHNDNPGRMGTDANKGIDEVEVTETLDNDNKYRFCDVTTSKGQRGHADQDVLDEDIASLSLVTLTSDTKLGFLKLKRGSGRRISAPEEVPEAPLTDYEKEREENILRNQHFMQKLGLTWSALRTYGEPSSHSWTKPKERAINKVKPPPFPVRRSRRLIQESIGSRAQVDEEAVVEIVPHVTALEEEPLFYDESSVLKYTCGKAVTISASYPCQEFTKPGANNILGFRPLDEVLQDRYLTRIYTMSACFVAHSQQTLLAAGGHQGHIAVFGTTTPSDESHTITEPSISDITGDTVSQEPLLSWKGSSGWISGVKFLSVQNQENSNLLLSSANDGNLVLWDINKQQKVQHSIKPLAGFPPMKVTEALGIHTNGIFSMHEFCGHVVTVSKDATVGYSKVTNQEIIAERSISGHHAGPIKGVNFRDASIIADCGSDGLVCILDLRMVQPCTVCINTADPTGVNVVEWCPSQEHLLLSASKDPQISLHDIRSTKEPLYKLSGHVNPKVKRCSQIYRPTFVAQGAAIASPGQGSKAISLYSVDTGKAISRGYLGYDATMVMWSARSEKFTSALWVASRHISQLLPLWQN